MNLLPNVGWYLASLLGVTHRHWLPFRFSFAVQPALALVAGVLILVRPKFLNFVVAVYLIIVGLIGLLHLV